MSAVYMEAFISLRVQRLSILGDIWRLLVCVTETIRAGRNGRVLRSGPVNCLDAGQGISGSGVAGSNHVMN